jgi:hypothetical protein
MVLLICGLAATTRGCGCAKPSDLRAIQEHGGRWIPNGEIPFVTALPVQHIWFANVDDAGLALVMPHLLAVPAESMTLSGKGLTDASIVELNKLTSLQRLYLGGTNVSRG